MNATLELATYNFDKMIHVLNQVQLEQIATMESNRSKNLPPSLDKIYRAFITYTDGLDSAITQLESEYEVEDRTEVLEAIETEINLTFEKAKPYVVKFGQVVNLFNGMRFMIFFCKSAQPRLQRVIEIWWDGIGSWQA